jgi:hypothetical protein
LNPQDFVEKETSILITFPSSFAVEQGPTVIDAPKAEFRMNLENSLLKFRAYQSIHLSYLRIDCVRLLADTPSKTLARYFAGISVVLYVKQAPTWGRKYAAATMRCKEAPCFNITAAVLTVVP